MPTQDTITLPAKKLKTAVAAIGKLNTLVPLLKGQIADVYVVLLGETKTGRMRMEHYRNGLRIRCLFDGARIESTLPVVALCIEHNFFNAVKRDDDVTFSKPATGSSLQFKQGPSSGIVALTPPSEFKSPQLPPHDRFVRIPVDVIRAGLAATAFSSQDPTMSASGVLSSIQMRDGELNVITYDSMCGALYKRGRDELAAEIPDGFELTLPNQMLNSILSQADTPEIGVSIGMSDLCFKTDSLEVIFPKSEYPTLPVAESVKQMVENAQHGFNVDTATLLDAVTTNATYLSVDKDANNIAVDIGPAAARISVKSSKINHNCSIAVENFKGVPFSFSCDVARLHNFTRLIKAWPRVTVLFANHRIIFKVPGALYVFTES